MAADATLEAEQIISYTRTVIINVITSLQDPNGKVILVLEVHDLLNRILDILEKAVYLFDLFGQVANSVYVIRLWHSCHPALSVYSALCHTVNASEFIFLYWHTSSIDACCNLNTWHLCTI